MNGGKQFGFQSAHDQAQAIVGQELILLSGIKEGDRVLDLGCGSGNLSSRILEVVGESGEVTGIDPDEDNVELAKNNNCDFRNVNFETCSGVDFGKGCANTFDVVFSCLVLNWLPNEEKAPTFQRVLDMLKPGGVFAVAVAPTLPTSWKLVMDLLQPNEAADIHDHVEARLLSDIQLKELALKTGFEIVSCSSQLTTGPAFKEDEINEFLSHVGCVFRGYADIGNVREEDILRLSLPRTADGKISVDGHIVFALFRKPVK